jgi:CRISPR-associated protein Cas1
VLNRIVEIAEDQRYLSVLRGFMVIESTGVERRELGRIPLDDIGAVIANAHGLSYTNNLLVALAERGAPFVLCGSNHNVVGMLFSVDGNHHQAKRFDAQIRISKPIRDRLWADVIKSKLAWQAAVLERVGSPSAPLKSLVGKVKSGDFENIEAQGARRYWTLLFGPSFRRNQEAQGANAMLNYGYTVLRAMTARAVVAAGLHPTLGLHHSNESNPMRLVDDLMEPFRPVIDFKVWQLCQKGKMEINAIVKREIVLTMFVDIETKDGISPLSVCIQKAATSLAQIYLGEEKKLYLPTIFPSIEEFMGDDEP